MAYLIYTGKSGVNDIEQASKGHLVDLNYWLREVPYYQVLVQIKHKSCGCITCVALLKRHLDGSVHMLKTLVL